MYKEEPISIAIRSRVSTHSSNSKFSGGRGSQGRKHIGDTGGDGRCRKHKSVWDSILRRGNICDALGCVGGRSDLFDRKSRNLYTSPVFDAPVGRPRRNLAKAFSTRTRDQSNLTKSASRGANSPVRGHVPRGSKFVPLDSWGRVSY